MNFEFRPSPDFVKSVKALSKRYPSLKDDLLALRQSLEQDPYQGVDLGGGLRIIRMNIRSKGRGKAGGARVITCNVIISMNDMVIALVYIYDKADASSVKDEAMKAIVKEMGLL
ncbi:MAG: addiction module toxin RelE [Bacteroidaceae bacterium]|nr:addiction module toxin RelE [Bacteroidaceae bacterium]